MPNSSRTNRRLRAAAALALACVALPVAAATDGDQERFRSLYQELVETDTTLTNGSCTLAAERMRKRLLAAGYRGDQFRVVTAAEFPKQGNLVGAVAGSDPTAPALLLLAHIDVVEAKRADWTRDPFKLIEENGYFHARGAIDDKAMAASFVDALIRLREAGLRLRRTIKLALTCGEETDDVFNGVQYLLAHEPATLRAGLAINEGGKGYLDEQGRPQVFGVQAGEKIYQDFTLTTSSPGGHSSRPGKDNAITRLARGLARLGGYQFPAAPGEVTRKFFARTASLHTGAVAEAMRSVGAGHNDAAALRILSEADPVWNAMLRTTCVATLMDAGHAPNALPQKAEANVNCRILPGSSVEEVRAHLIDVLAEPSIAVTLRHAPGPVSPAPPLTPAVMTPIESIAADMWPGVPVIPSLSTGATDGRFLLAAGIPTYGVSGVFVDPDGNGVHGRDERVRVKSLYDARTFLYRLIQNLAGAQ